MLKIERSCIFMDQMDKEGGLLLAACSLAKEWMSYLHRHTHTHILTRAVCTTKGRFQYLIYSLTLVSCPIHLTGPSVSIGLIGIHTCQEG